MYNYVIFVLRTTSSKFSLNRSFELFPFFGLTIIYIVEISGQDLQMRIQLKYNELTLIFSHIPTFYFLHL